MFRSIYHLQLPHTDQKLDALLFVPTIKKRDFIAATVLCDTVSNNDPQDWAPSLSYTSSHIASDTLLYDQREKACRSTIILHFLRVYVNVCVF